jgi:hypothetical protein
MYTLSSYLAKIHDEVMKEIVFSVFSRPLRKSDFATSLKKRRIVIGGSDKSHGEITCMTDILVSAACMD